MRCSEARAGQEEAVRQGADMLEFVGLDRLRHEPVGSLNLHQQRFLELARQLAGRPRLVLLDEVMAGLNDTELAASIDIVRRRGRARNHGDLGRARDEGGHEPG